MVLAILCDNWLNFFKWFRVEILEVSSLDTLSDWRDFIEFTSFQNSFGLFSSMNGIFYNVLKISFQYFYKSLIVLFRSEQ